MIPRFKIWDKDKSKMYTVKEVDEINFEIEQIGVFDLETKVDKNIKFEDVEFLQSTGLYDRNGVEIFEGDIVKSTYNTINEERTKIEVVDVVGEVYKNYGAYYIDGYLFLHLNNLEVIGNIYEHEHLLEGE